MFVEGFTKIAKKYSQKEHHLEQEELSAKHLAKMEPVHRGKATAVGAAAGGAYGAGIGLLNAPGSHKMHASLARGRRHGFDVKWTKRKNYGKLLAGKAGKGAAIGGAVGGLAGLGLSHLNNKFIQEARRLNKMDPKERRGYLTAQYERQHGRED